MAAGFSKKEVFSKAGRKIKPTDKVRQLLCESMLTGYDDVCAELQEDERLMRLEMAKGCSPKELQRLMNLQAKHRADLNDMLAELSTLASLDDLQRYNKHYQELLPTLDAVKADCVQYCASRGDNAQDETARKIAAIKRKAWKLENQIHSVELELTKTRLNYEKDREISKSLPVLPTPPEKETKATASSTPLKDGTDPVSFNQLSTIRPDTAQSQPAREAAPPSSDATAAALIKLATVLEAKQQGNRLPRLEPETFSGELTQFPSWWSAFETMIESHARTEKEKLFFLTKYTSGAARESIKGFVNLYHDDAAYARAKSIIINRFGNRLRIAEAYKDRLNSWPKVKSGDGQSLQKYADYLWQCHAAMESLSYVTDLSCQEENLKMVNKLPAETAERWDRITDEAVYGDECDQTAQVNGLTGRYPTFLEFCKFVGLEARIATGPRASKADDVAVKKKQSYATEATESKKPSRRDRSAKCSFCQKEHYLQKCEEFLNQPAGFKKAFAREKALCYGCLKRSHVYRDCRTKDPALMAERNPGQGTTSKVRTMCTGSSPGQRYFSSVVPVVVCNDENAGQTVKVYAIIDSQSDCCFVSDWVVDRLQPHGRRVTLELTTMGRKETIKTNAHSGLVVKGVNAKKHISLPPCYAKRRIPVDEASIPDPLMMAYWPHLNDIAQEMMPKDEEMPVGLLLGYNFPEALYREDSREDGLDKPFATKSPLGWYVNGRMDQAVDNVLPMLCYKTVTKEVTNDSLRQVFDQGFELDSDDDSMISHEDRQFMEIMREGVQQLPDGHFQLPLPLRELPDKLPPTKDMALACLNTVRKKMIRNPEFGQKYAAFMEDIIAAGHAEPVEEPDLVEEGKSWYWLNHGVVHPRKPDKVRGVMNGSTTVKGVSLNALLMPGPDQLNSLVGVLTRFRSEKVAVTCDVRRMFYQVQVNPEHRDYLRFVWFDKGDVYGPVKDYRMTVHPFGATSSPGVCNFAFRETARRFEHKFGRRAAEFIEDHFYVDDGLGAEPDDAAAERLIRNSHEMCKAGGFWLHKYMCSSAEVLKKIPKELLASSVQNVQLGAEPLPDEVTLGVEMAMQHDAFMYRVSVKTERDSRRAYLSALSAVFDPLGLVSPVLLPGRLILQDLCQKRLEWDVALPEAVKKQWKEWHEQLESLREMKITRCVRRTVELPIISAELHTFTDASSKGYGACCYLRLTDGRGNVDVTLLFAKSKVGPSKAVTIPRMELQAAVLGVKMSRFLAKELRYAELQQHFWSDSRVALAYVSNKTRRFHIYVANRAQYIRSHSQMQNWHYIPTDVNPADIASRGAEARELVNSDLWWSGPPVLKEAAQPGLPEMEIDSDDPEVKPEKLSMKASTEPSWLFGLCQHAGSWRRLRGILARVLQFVDRVRSRLKRDAGEDRVEFVERAEALIIRLNQNDHYPELMLNLERYRGCELNESEAKKRADLLKSEQSLSKLDVFIDQAGVMRVGGRLGRKDMPAAVAHPALLPRRGDITRLLVEHFHEQTRHMGPMTTLNAMRRSGLWLLHGRATINHYTHECVVCQRIRGKFQNQKMAELPEERLEETPPFTYVAVDCFGPFYIRLGRGTVKYWCCVFVCLGCRAVHIEVLESMDTSAYINAYRRFVARRGPIRTMFCDRGTNFVGARAELQRALNEDQMDVVADHLAQDKVDCVHYVFNYPKASHMAGAWERLIRTIRSALAHVLLQHGEYIPRDVFLTMIVEAEALVNQRPITAMSEADPNDPAPLCPAQILTMKQATLKPLPGKFLSAERYTKKRWRFVQYLLEQFWQRWRHEYLQNLQERAKWVRSRQNLQEGDLVLLHEDNVPRSCWPKGMITEAEPSRDGRVRKVTVKTVGGEYKRPVHKLVLLYRKEADMGPSTI